MPGQRTVRERSEYSLTVLSTRSARELHIYSKTLAYAPLNADFHLTRTYVNCH